jgi:hypothetical protein
MVHHFSSELMDPRKLFIDERHLAFCFNCGAEPSTRDHIPSRVLLDDPLPENLPVVQCCRTCNEKFSIDEPYVACLLEAVIVGSTDSVQIRRPKVRRILESRPHFRREVEAGSLLKDGRRYWRPDQSRVKNVLLKLARGHAAYECGEPLLEHPSRLWHAPLQEMPVEGRLNFEAVPDESVWPELGSRAFLAAVVGGGEAVAAAGWQTVQPGRYRYLVSHSPPLTVRFVLSEYLAAEVQW